MERVLSHWTVYFYFIFIVTLLNDSHQRDRQDATLVPQNDLWYSPLRVMEEERKERLRPPSGDGKFVTSFDGVVYVRVSRGGPSMVCKCMCLPLRVI